MSGSQGNILRLTVTKLRGQFTHPSLAHSGL